jgi:hypothetical protein
MYIVGLAEYEHGDNPILRPTKAVVVVVAAVAVVVVVAAVTVVNKQCGAGRRATWRLWKGEIYSECSGSSANSGSSGSSLQTEWCSQRSKTGTKM